MFRYVRATLLLLLASAFADENATVPDSDVCAESTVDLAICYQNSILPKVEYTGIMDAVLDDNASDNGDLCSNALENAEPCPTPYAEEEEDLPSAYADLESLAPYICDADSIAGAAACPSIACLPSYLQFTVCALKKPLDCLLDLQVCAYHYADTEGVLFPDPTCEDYQRKKCARVACANFLEPCGECIEHLDAYNTCVEEEMREKWRCDPPSAEQMICFAGATSHKGVYLWTAAALISSLFL